jgi:anti-sigma-K factor RskA
MSMTDNHVLELLTEYALGLLAVDESNTVAEHLSVCESCQVEYLGLKEVVDDLPLALSRPRLRRSKEPPVQGNPYAQGLRFLLPSFWQRLVTMMRQRAPAFALAIIVILALGNLIQWNQTTQLDIQPSPSMHVVALSSTKNAPSAMGTLIIDQAGHYGTLVVDRLVELDPGLQYQVWLILDGNRTSAGLFSVNYAGYASLELTAPQPLIDYDSIGITIEPAGGSPAPTGARVLGGDIPN